MRILSPLLLLLALAPPALAQHADSAAAFPAGWTVRPDRAGTAAADVHFLAAGTGFRTLPGPAAILWDSTNTARGTYRAHATFRQMSATPHAESYGVFVGGRELQGSGQHYLYFLIRQDGKFLVKHRAGDETHTLVDWTASPAIRAGTAANTLAVVAGADSVRFRINGRQVAGLERTSELETDGVVGLRVNHQLQLRIRDFGVEPLKTPEPGSGR